MPVVACSASVLVESTTYPDLEHVVSTADKSEHTSLRSRRERILSRAILVALVLLAIVSLISTLVAWSIISHKDLGRTKSISIAQILDLIASAFSILYILLHAIAAGSNTSVQTDVPKVSKLHKGCLILARFTFVAWLICFVITIVILSNAKACLAGTKVCQLQIADMVASSIGLLSICAIWITLEICKEPFGPARIPQKRTSTVRISAFTSLVDLLGRFATPHASRAPSPSLQASNTNEKCPGHQEVARSGTTYTQRLLRKPLPIRHTYHSDEAPPRPLTPLLPMLQRQSSRGWGEEWTHLLRDTSPKRKRRALPRLDSGFSLASKLSGSSSRSSKSTSSTSPRRCRKCRCTEVVTPSSSISDKSQRSPLSTVRSAEQPNVLLRAALRYSPPGAFSHEWRSTTSATMPSPPATVYRTSSLTLIPAPLMIRKVDDQPPQPRETDAPGLVRRNTVEIKVPGAYDSLELRPSSDEGEHERTISGQVRRRDAEYVNRIPSKRSQSRCPNRRPVGGVTKRSSVSTVSSRSRYREQRPVHVKQEWISVKVEKRISGRKDSVKKDATQPGIFKRLTLGDLTFGFGNLFD